MTTETAKPLALGDHCRASCGAPARYIVDGLCLFVSAQDCDLMVDTVRPGEDGNPSLPTPTDAELQAASAMHRRLSRDHR